MSKKFPGFCVKYINTLGNAMEFESNAFDAADAIKKLKQHRGGIKKVESVKKIPRIRS